MKKSFFLVLVVLISIVALILSSVRQAYAADELSVSPAQLTNEVSVGHLPSSQTIYVRNIGAAPRSALEYTISDNVSWLSVSPTNGLVQNNTNAVTISYSTMSSVGIFTGTVTFTTSSNSLTAQVIMRVNPIPSIGKSMSSQTNMIATGQTLPAGTLQIWNNSAEPKGRLKYELSRNITWVSLSSESGTSTGEHRSVTVTYSTATLPPGIYAGRITIDGSDDTTGNAVANTPVYVGLKLTVTEQARLAITTSSFSNDVMESASVTSQFAIWNGRSFRGPMAYTVQSDRSWLLPGPSSGTVITDTNTISVVFAPGTRLVGTYSGKITVSATDTLSGSSASGSPRTINVTMVITPRTPVNYELPEIQGIPYVGQTLNTYNGIWQNVNRLTFDYQWQRASTFTGSGLADINSATNANYVVQTADRGRFLRVKVTAKDSLPYLVQTTVSSLFTNTFKIKVVSADFNNDGLTDLWFFDSYYGIWRYAYTGRGGSGELQFGSWSMEPVPGDYDGDGLLDFGVYDPSSGMWYVLLTGPWTLKSVPFGWGDTIPAIGDYDGDGKTDVAVYWPAGGIWFILKSSTGQIETIAFGWYDTVPVQADYDGNGVTEVAVYWAEGGKWFIRLTPSTYRMEDLGNSDNVAVPGDYDGDGKSDICVYQPASNIWTMALSASGGAIQQRSFGVNYGNPIPITGYFDYDASCDPVTVQIFGNFILWSVQRTTSPTNEYRGQSYDASSATWRVSW